MRTDLNSFIKRLKEVRDKPLTITEKQIKDIFWTVLYEISSLTVVDTYQARSAVVEEFSRKYGYDVSGLFDQPEWRYWEENGFPENEMRAWGNSKTKYSDDFSGKNAEVNISIDDVGFYNQEVGHHPSEKHAMATGRDNSQFKRRMVTHVTDNFDKIEDFQKYVRKLIDVIEKHLFEKI